MSNAIVFAFPGHDRLATALVARLGAERGRLALHDFPDGESYVRLEMPVAGRDVVLVCGLHRPNEKIVPLLFAAGAARDLGASSVGLVAPYLAYMRQDRRFEPGEAVTSATFAAWVSSFADWLVTAEPHLHRRGSLADIYAARTGVVHAGEAVARWVGAHVRNALIIGPDRESERWVSEVARLAGAPYLVLEKTRRGERAVEVSLPDIAAHAGRTPVLVDDIISTARTMIAAVRALREARMPAPACIGVHAVFAGPAYEELQAAGAGIIVTCNTISHPSNAIDLDGALADAAARMAGALAGAL